VDFLGQSILPSPSPPRRWVAEIVLRWPLGSQEMMRNVAVNQTIKICEDRGWLRASHRSGRRYRLNFDCWEISQPV
jgi:hypothetical protein